MNEMMISVDIMPTLSALCGSDAAALLVGRTPSAEPHPSADAVTAFQTAMSSLVAENREVQAVLEKAVPLPLEVPTPVVPTPVETPVAQTPVVKPEVPITPEIVREFAEVVAPLVAENREVQVALEKVVPLPLEVPTPVVQMPSASVALAQDAVAPVVKPEVPITPEIVRGFAEVVAPLVAENREVQVALEKVVPLPLEVPTPVVQMPVVKPEVPITPEIVREFAEVVAPLVAENREVQAVLEKVVPLPLEVPTPVAQTPSASVALVQDAVAPVVKPEVPITPEIVREFAEVVAPLVAENREVQVALEKVVPLPLEVPTPVVQTPVAQTPVDGAAPVAQTPSASVALAQDAVAPVVKPEVPVTPEIVREFAEVVAPLVAENREVQAVLEKVVPLPLEVPTPVAQTPSASVALVQDAVAPVVKPEVPITPEIVREFAEVVAPLVAENREVQVALEKVVPLPLEVQAPVVQTPVDGTTPVAQTPSASVALVQDAVAPVVKPEVPITPEIVREFAEVVAPLVAENREVQVALEKVVPLPLGVPTPAVKPEAVAVKKDNVPSVDSPDAEAVLQAAPVVLPTQVETVVRPDMAQQTIAGVEASASAPKVAPTPSEVLIAAAEAVADTIMVTPGLLAGEGQIRVQLRPDVLAGTEIQINVTGKTIAVEFLPQTTDMGVLIQRCLPQLEQHLAAKIHSFTIAATVGTVRRRKV